MIAYCSSPRCWDRSIGNLRRFRSEGFNYRGSTTTVVGSSRAAKPGAVRIVFECAEPAGALPPQQREAQLGGDAALDCDFLRRRRLEGGGHLQLDPVGPRLGQLDPAARVDRMPADRPA